MGPDHMDFDQILEGGSFFALNLLLTFKCTYRFHYLINSF